MLKVKNMLSRRDTISLDFSYQISVSNLVSKVFCSVCFFWSVYFFWHIFLPPGDFEVLTLLINGTENFSLLRWKPPANQKFSKTFFYTTKFMIFCEQIKNLSQNAQKLKFWLPWLPSIMAAICKTTLYRIVNNSGMVCDMNLKFEL